MQKYILNLFIISVLSITISCEPEKNKVETNETTSNEVEINVETESGTETVSLNLAPNFILKDIDGKTVKLADFKGDVVYMDIWATWCGPCIQQIPYMKELEKRFHDQSGIQFVSVSVDKEKDMQKWYNFVQQKEMSGVQLFAGKLTPFGNDYNVKSIPKFIILGKNGELLDDNAPRPSEVVTNENGRALGLNESLVTYLNGLITEGKS